jgi:uncharacterized protein YdhG (YjbR/CyaY superfamily)
MSRTERWASIDAYIAAAPADRRALLDELRATIRAAAPQAKETISYNMPAFAENGTLVYFATMTNHIGFYPTASGIAAFQEELAAYAGSKGAVHLPLDRPLPLDLIQRMVQFRVEENRRKVAGKTQTSPVRAPGQGT